MPNESTQSGAFKVPNSVIQGLTTATPPQLNRLSTMQMMTLFGLLTLVDKKQPEREVRAKVSDLLEIIEVSRTVAHVVDREWDNADGASCKKRYSVNRFSPSHVQRINDALVALHNQQVVVFTESKQNHTKREVRTVHILDMFGFEYTQNGKPLDVHNLPSGLTKMNAGTSDRPLWKVRKQGEDRNERVSGILFRLNAELVREMRGEKGTVKHTVLARKIFNLFRQLCRQPATIRLAVLVLRQTDTGFTRALLKVLDDLGFDIAHRSRAVEQLRAACRTLMDSEVIKNFEIDPASDRVWIERNREWHRIEEEP